MLLEAEEQALPQARSRIEAWKRGDLCANGLPVGLRINEYAAIGMRRKHERLVGLQQRCTVARGDSDASLGVERDDRRSVKR
jgi:hypothetical protein